MEAKQLRLGNLILENGKITEVENLSNGKINHQNYHRENPIQQPIPLTEEILLKVGFEKMPHFTVMNSLIYKLVRNSQLSIGCVGTPNEMLFITEVDDEDNPTKVDDLICLHNFDYDGKLYLHKLQNIVDIFGQELNTSGLINNLK